ncbi:MAG: hypothetical protein Q8P67_09025 [archaeon]|nr:hypothetical protein [archaeon]
MATRPSSFMRADSSINHETCFRPRGHAGGQADTNQVTHASSPSPPTETKTRRPAPSSAKFGERKTQHRSAASAVRSAPVNPNPNPDFPENPNHVVLDDFLGRFFFA